MQPGAGVSTSSSHRRGQGRHYEQLTLVRTPLNAVRMLSESTLSLANGGARHAAHLFKPFTGRELLTRLFFSPFLFVLLIVWTRAACKVSK